MVEWKYKYEEEYEKGKWELLLDGEPLGALFKSKTRLLEDCYCYISYITWDDEQIKDKTLEEAKEYAENIVVDCWKDELNRLWKRERELKRLINKFTIDK